MVLHRDAFDRLLDENAAIRRALLSALAGEVRRLTAQLEDLHFLDLPGRLARHLLREIEADGFKVLHQRISLTPLRKLWIAMRTNWRGR